MAALTWVPVGEAATLGRGRGAVYRGRCGAAKWAEICTTSKIRMRQNKIKINDHMLIEDIDIEM